MLLHIDNVLQQGKEMQVQTDIFTVQLHYQELQYLLAKLYHYDRNPTQR